MICDGLCYHFEFGMSLAQLLKMLAHEITIAQAFICSTLAISVIDVGSLPSHYGISSGCYNCIKGWDNETSISKSLINVVTFRGV